jgi:4-hydroxy-tetrahydrodipicolinate synthase
MSAHDTPAWHGVLVATAIPFDDELRLDLDRYREHVRWLADSGCDGVTPNGSLGEYQVLTAEERAAVVRAAVEVSPEGFTVMPGVAAYGAQEARRWAEDAAEAGAGAVMLLPPNSYRADESAVVEHYAEVARTGLPIVAYNNPIDTKVDLTPELLARLHGEGLIVAVKEFSGDVRRAYRINEIAPGLDVLVGADDVALEVGLAGAPGWISGYPNAFPHACVELFAAIRAGDADRAVSQLSSHYRRVAILIRRHLRDASLSAKQRSRAIRDIDVERAERSRRRPRRGQRDAAG